MAHSSSKKEMEISVETQLVVMGRNSLPVLWNASAILCIQVYMLGSERQGTSRWLASFISQWLLQRFCGNAPVCLEDRGRCWLTLCQQLQNWQQRQTKHVQNTVPGREPLRNPADWISGSWWLWSLSVHQGQGPASGVFPFSLQSEPLLPVESRQK